VIVGLQTEVARYTEILKQELEKICKAQRQSNQLRGNIKAAEEQHLQIRTNIQSAEATLQLVLAQVAEAEEKLNRVNEQLTAPKERQTTIPFPTVRASVRKDLSGNGNGNAPEAESA
jgi:chromosome segregation ATPase